MYIYVYMNIGTFMKTSMYIFRCITLKLGLRSQNVLIFNCVYDII